VEERKREKKKNIVYGSSTIKELPPGLELLVQCNDWRTAKAIYNKNRKFRA